MLPISDYVQIVIGIMATFSPFAAIPIFISLTSNHSDADRLSTAKTSAIAAGMTGIVSVWIGQYILMFFGISIAAFKIAGGILLLTMAINMLHAQVPKAKNTKKELKEAQNSTKEIAVVPLAIPLIAGPGAISTIIIFSQQTSAFMHLIMMSLIMIGLSLYIWVSLRMSSFINRKLGVTGLSIISRVMGLILASISIEFMISGLKTVFPVLAS